MTVPTGTEQARPFPPTQHFETSKAFYEAPGFEKLLDGEVAIFAVGASAFILQRYYQEDWGLRIACVVDPAGVLWHVAQRREGVPRSKAPR
jgi:hypothetical protein